MAAGRKPAGKPTRPRAHPNAKTVVFSCSIREDVSDDLDAWLERQPIPISRSAVVTEAIRLWLKSNAG